MLGSTEVHWILADNGRSVNILFKDAFDKMILSMKIVTIYNRRLHGFLGEDTMPLGRLDLFVEIGTRF